MENDKIKKIYKTTMLIFVTALITFLITSIYSYKKLGQTTNYLFTSNINSNSELLNKVSILKQIIDKKSIFSADEEKMVDNAIKGYVSALGDTYTEYFTKSEMDEFKQETEGNYVGIGIYMYLNSETNTIEVLYPIENSPAEKAGIKTGDIIKKVDDVEYTGDDFEKISTYIKGKEGTTVKIEVERDKERITFEVERASIDLYPMKSEVLSNNIGYIKVSSFSEDTSKEFKTIYENLSKSNIKGLIIDLRDNGGGILDEALNMADYALDKDKTMLIAKDKDGKEEISKSKQKPIINVPFVVLVNENSASASEILTAALKDNGRATVVGIKTYGKGLIQELLTLSDGSGIKITTEEYCTPNGTQINKIGITPDIIVDLPGSVNSQTVERENDTQLQEAIKLFK